MANTYSYGCVIDAGSSGSRIHVYQWQSQPLSAPITKYFTHESSPGISDPNHGVAVLLDLIGLARVSLPRSIDLDTVPIFLGATAGMRILDPATEASIMKEVRSLLRTSGFVFRDEWARTISGEEEGAYGWLVANYLMNGARLPGIQSDTTYGAIDLGGASAQISFRPSGAI
jgi:apyrase